MFATNNQLTSSRFTLTISGDEFRDVVAAITEFTHPGVNSNAVAQPARQIKIPRVGSSIEYEPLVVRVLLDSDMNIYSAIYDWLRDNIETEEETERDLTLTIYNKNGGREKDIRYLGAFPTSIGPLQFTSTDQNDTIVSADITFAYSHFEI